VLSVDGWAFALAVQLVAGKVVMMVVLWVGTMDDSTEEEKVELLVRRRALMRVVQKDQQMVVQSVVLKVRTKAVQSAMILVVKKESLKAEMRADDLVNVMVVTLVVGSEKLKVSRLDRKLDVWWVELMGKMMAGWSVWQMVDKTVDGSAHQWVLKSVGLKVQLLVDEKVGNLAELTVQMTVDMSVGQKVDLSAERKVQLMAGSMAGKLVELMVDMLGEMKVVQTAEKKVAHSV